MVSVSKFISQQQQPAAFKHPFLNRRDNVVLQVSMVGTTQNQACEAMQFRRYQLAGIG